MIGPHTISWVQFSLDPALQAFAAVKGVLFIAWPVRVRSKVPQVYVAVVCYGEIPATRTVDMQQ